MLSISPLLGFKVTAIRDGSMVADARSLCTGFAQPWRTWAQEQRRDDGSRLFDQETIDGALAHFVGGVTGTYQRSQHLEARRKLASAWGAFASTRADPSERSDDAPLAPAMPTVRSKAAAPG
jgi:hypothetical protein